MTAAPSLPPGVTEVPLGDAGLRAWQVDTPACRALVSRQGGQLLAFQGRGRPPLLWCSPRALLVPGKAIRGGIPLCFPWFGPAPGGAPLPAHGFARLQDWQLAGATRLGETVQLDLHLEASAATRALWPHDFQARLRLTLGQRLSLQLTVANPGRGEFAFTFAFHSYLALADSHRARLEGLDGALCIDQAAPGRPRQVHAGALRFVDETDRIFLHTGGHCRLVDEAAAREVRCLAPDCRSVIAWNPGPARAARLADLGADAWQGMACVEAGNVEDDAVTLPGGGVRRFDLLLEEEAEAPLVGRPSRREAGAGVALARQAGDTDTR